MRITFIAQCLLAAALIWTPAALAGDKQQVVTTTSDLASIAQAIGGDHVQAKSICTGQEDPHVLQAKPSFIMLARNADLWIRIGMELEIGWENPVIDGSRNRKIRVGAGGHLDASEGVLRLDVPSGQKIDRSMGDVHPLGNPHYWLDPWNGRIVAQAIRDRLKTLDAARGADYEANCAAFIKKLDEGMFGAALVEKFGGEALWRMELAGALDAGLKEKNAADQLAGWAGKLRPYRGTKILTYHKSWIYFTNRFGLSIVGELEPKPGIPPSPGHLAQIVETAKTGGGKLILVEPFYEKKGPKFVAERAGIPVVEAANSTGGVAEASDYVAMLEQVVTRVTGALQGKGITP